MKIIITQKKYFNKFYINNTYNISMEKIRSKMHIKASFVKFTTRELSLFNGWYQPLVEIYLNSKNRDRYS